MLGKIFNCENGLHSCFFGVSLKYDESPGKLLQILRETDLIMVVFYELLVPTNVAKNLTGSEFENFKTSRRRIMIFFPD